MKYPAYVHITKFVVVPELLKLIETLPDNERINYCFLQSLIIRLSKDTPNFFVNIHRTVWKNFMGNNYNKYIKDMIEWKMIERQDAYLNETDGFTKSYRLPAAHQNTEKIIVKFPKKRINPLIDKSVLMDDVSIFVHQNLKKLTVRNELKETVDSIQTVENEYWANKIYWQNFNLHYGNTVGRMFHTVIVMPKASRCDLVWKEDNQIKLFEYDIQSCHPVLLLSLMVNEAEKESYKKLLDTDIYTTIAEKMHISKNRKIIKEDFMYFIYGESKNYFYTYFTQNFPIFMQQKNVLGKTMASVSQNMEANIMVKELPTKIMQQHAGYFYIPMHDGWLGLQRDEEAIKLMVTEFFFALTGYTVKINRKEV